MNFEMSTQVITYNFMKIVEKFDDIKKTENLRLFPRSMPTRNRKKETKLPDVAKVYRPIIYEDVILESSVTFWRLAEPDNKKGRKSRKYS